MKHNLIYFNRVKNLIVLSLLKNQMFFEIAALKVSQYSEQNTCAGVCFNKVAGLQLSCEYYKIFKNGLFHKTPPMSTSEELEGGRTQG